MRTLIILLLSGCVALAGNPGNGSYGPQSLLPLNSITSFVIPNTNQIIVKFFPNDRTKEGTYNMVFNGAGPVYYFQQTNGINFIGFNDPNWGNGYWTLGVSNDTGTVDYNFGGGSATIKNPSFDDTGAQTWVNAGGSYVYASIYYGPTATNASVIAQPSFTYWPASTNALNWYVNPSIGLDGNDGQTPASAYQSIDYACLVAPSNAVINLSGGLFKTISPAARPLQVIDGAGIGATVITNSCLLYTNITIENCTVQGLCAMKGAGNFLFQNDELGSYTNYNGQLTLESLDTAGSGQNFVVKSSNIICQNTGYDSFTGCNATFANDFIWVQNFSGGNTTVPCTRGLHITGTDIVRVYNCSITISNAYIGTIPATGVTNACIIMDGTSCQLYIGNTTLDNVAVSSVPIAYVNSATSAQVHQLTSY